MLLVSPTVLSVDLAARLPLCTTLPWLQFSVTCTGTLCLHELQHGCCDLRVDTAIQVDTAKDMAGPGNIGLNSRIHFHIGMP
jgi:hypothetical protein